MANFTSNLSDREIKEKLNPRLTATRKAYELQLRYANLRMWIARSFLGGFLLSCIGYLLYLVFQAGGWVAYSIIGVLTAFAGCLVFSVNFCLDGHPPEKPKELQ